MPKVYKFRVLIDHADDVFRDIDIMENQTFEDLHHAILDAFKFKGQQMASFYMSNDEWDKGREITLLDMYGSAGKSKVDIMSKTILKDCIEEPNQKIVYVFDFLLMWCFFIELVKTEKSEKGITYPICKNEYGKAPDQHSKKVDSTTEFNADILEEDIFEGGDDAPFIE